MAVRTAVMTPDDRNATMNEESALVSGYPSAKVHLGCRSCKCHNNILFQRRLDLLH